MKGKIEIGQYTGVSDDPSSKWRYSLPIDPWIYPLQKKYMLSKSSHNMNVKE